MAPENGGPLEREIPNLETIIFGVYVSFRGCMYNFEPPKTLPWRERGKKLQLSKLTCSRFWWVLSETVATSWLKKPPFFMIDRWFATARAQKWNNLTKWDGNEMECRCLIPLVSGLRPTCRGSIASILQRMNFSISCNIQMHLGLVDQYTYIIHLVSVYHSNTVQIHIL